MHERKLRLFLLFFLGINVTIGHYFKVLRLQYYGNDLGEKDTEMIKKDIKRLKNTSEEYLGLFVLVCVPFVLGGSCHIPGGSHVEFVHKALGKVGGIREAYLVHNFGDGQFLLRQQHGGFL